MKKIHIIFILLIVSCTSVRTTGVIDNNYKTYKISRLVIFINVKNLNQRSYYESKLYNNLKDYSVDRCRSIDILPPVREYTDKEYSEIIQKYNIDTFLILNIENMGYSHTQMTVNKPYETKGYFRGSTFSMSTSGGPETYDISKPFLTVNSELYDVKSNKTFWRSTTDSSGNAFINLNYLLGESFNDIISSLVKYHFINGKN
jgi:hypothetical protein